MDMTVKIIWNVKNLGMYEWIPGLKDLMKHELIRVYNIYAERVNSGITEKLNEEFANLNPNYFKENEGKEWYDLTEYNSFMANGYQRMVVDELNETNVSPLLDFFVDPNEVVFTGCLKADHNVTIDFCMKEV